MTDAGDIRVVSIEPILPAYVAWVDAHSEWADIIDTLPLFASAWHSRDDEVAALRAEIERLKDEQP